eukprot:gb/GECH01011662.1/.p1 GENE.gb/GECH01011662.1/~~gb/GECH01011662.1/.p1  ORF type:complete len:334 (+),score=86.13 gb/GECH01011662.1/:1-1002(+)
MDKLRASLRHNKQRVMRKMGKSDATVDEEFEDIHKRFTQLHKTNKESVKHIQQLIENFHAMSSNLQFLSEDFNTAYGSNSQEASEVQKLTNVAEQVEQNCVHTFQQQVQDDCLEGLQNFLVQFEPIEAQTKTRRTLLLDYDYYRDKVRQLTEKSSKDPLALPRTKEKLQQVKQEYDDINENLKNEMQTIIYNSKSVFDPAFEHLLSHLVKFYSSTYSSVQNLDSIRVSHIPAQTPPPISSKRSSSDSFSSPPVQSSTPPPQMYPSANNGASEEFDVEWFYLDGLNHQQGPVDLQNLKSLYSSGEVTDTTYVFGGDMEEWKFVNEVPGLTSALS